MIINNIHIHKHNDNLNLKPGAWYLRMTKFPPLSTFCQFLCLCHLGIGFWILALARIRKKQKPSKRWKTTLAHS